LKTCPGSGIDSDTTLAEVAAVAEANTVKSRNPGPFALSAAADQQVVARALLALTSSAAEPAVEEPLEADSPVTTRDLVTRDVLDPNTRQLLRPYVLTMRAGKYADDPDDLLPTSAADAKTIFTESLPAAYKAAQASNKPLRILFYAHGGLVSENSAIGQVNEQLQFWVKNDIYPIYFVWETGFLETLSQLIHGQLSREVAVPREPEFLNALVAKLARSLGGPTLWAGMQHSAELAARDDGASYNVAELLVAFLKTIADQDSVEIYAAGHSAGAIFHANFLPAAFSLGLKPINELFLLAPAVDEYKRTLIAQVGSGKNIPSATMFTMYKTFELADNCAHVYGHSLLYLIYHALEAKKETPILGLEEMLRSDADLAAQFSLNGNSGPGNIIFSKSDAGPSTASQATAHGAFHNDPPTMNSIARRILRIPDGQALTMNFPVAQPRAVCVPATAPVTNFISPGISISAWTAPVMTVTSATASGSGVKRALCVGIDNYPSAPLGGCVADATLWRDQLTQLGYSVSMLVNEQATEVGMLAAMRSLVLNAKAGDSLVVQYSGHGTELSDPSRPAAEGEEQGQDQAICAFDFADGGFIADKTVGSIYAQLPPGVSLTSFFDCCHSGSLSRFAVGQGLAPAGSNLKARYVIMRQQWYDRYVARNPLRMAMGARDVDVFRSKQSMRDVVFSACQIHEVAYESDGHGHFTLKAAGLLAGSLGQSTNQQFQQAIVTAFGSGSPQNPVLDTSQGLESAPFLGGTGVAVSAASPGRALSVSGGNNQAALLHVLKAAKLLIESNS